MNLLQAKQINTLYTSKSPAGHIGLLYIGGVIYFYRMDRKVYISFIQIMKV